MKKPSPFFRRAIKITLMLVCFTSQAALPIHSARHRVASKATMSFNEAIAATTSVNAPIGDRQAYGNLSLYFEPNYGQTDSQVRFVSHGSGNTLFLTSTAAVFSLTKEDEHKAHFVRRKGSENFPQQMHANEHASSAKSDCESEGRKTAAVRMQMVGANPEPLIEGIGRLTGISNYFIGNDPEKWRTNIPHYSAVRYHDVYPGIDLIYHSNEGELEFDFVIAAGRSTDTIKLEFEGAREIRIDGQGDLVLNTEAGQVRQHSPVVYQKIGEVKKEVAGRFAQTSDFEVGFEIGEYDKSKPLVIDPKLSFSTYLGSQAGSDILFGGSQARSDILFNGQPQSSVAVDPSGNVYIAGQSGSSDFATTPGAFQDKLQGFADAFVAKLSANGSELLYATYLGGANGISGATDIAVDSSGNVYLAGGTDSRHFPVMNAFQPESGDDFRTFSMIFTEGFVAKLNATGSGLIYSTYLGGRGEDFATSIAIDSSGSAYATGVTQSTNFPTTPGVFGQFPGSQSILDAFVTKLSDSGDLIYSTFSKRDFVVGSGIAVDSSGNAYVTGTASAGNFFNFFLQFPFVIKVNPSATALMYSSFPIGTNLGPGDSAIAVDASGNVYVTGTTSSSGLPVTEGAFQTAYAGGESEAFVAKLNSTGTALIYCTYLGGSASDFATDISVDSLGNAYVLGHTTSGDFPTRLPLQAINGGLFFRDAFLTALNASGTAIIYSTYIGGRGDDEGSALTVDSSGNAYAVGPTGSPDLLITQGAYQTAKQSDFDNFVVKVDQTPESGGFKVTNVSVVLDILLVVGEGFDRGAVVLLDGKEQATKERKKDPTVLMIKKINKKIKPGSKVTIQVQNPDGRLTDAFSFTRPKR